MTATFKSVKLFKQQVLGIGSYGKVCIARCDDLPCAAKVLHETLFDPNSQRELNDAERGPIRKFEQEREFMQELRHPNIVQYLGVYYEDPSTGLPALLMERMDENLTDFLKKATQPIRYDIQVNICHDMCLALSYLHSKGIIHRDLSSNNILLIGNVRAKVADFGMAKLSDLNPQGSRITMYPGTNVYMPPECFKTSKPKYSTKVDCFSFGVLIVQILTRKEPDPGEKLKEVEIKDPSFPSGRIEIPAPEIERRQEHINEIDERHPLRPLALKCLENEPAKRPSTQELCGDLAELKKRKEYNDSRSVVHVAVYDNGMAQQNGMLHVDRESSTCEVGVGTEKDELVAQLEEQVESLQEVIQQQRQQLEEVRSSSGEKDQLISERERRITEISQQLNAFVAEKENLEKRVQELGQYLKHWEHKNLILKWKKDSTKAPRAMYRSNDAVVDDSKAYFRPARTREVYLYDESQGWNRLPDCPYESSPLVIINNKLTAVGGCRNGHYTNELRSLVASEAGNKKRWIEEFPNMPTKRSHTSTLSTGAYLIVAGGKGEREMILRTVEVLDIEHRQWYSAADLHEPCWCSSMVVLDGCLFVVGGVNRIGNQTNLVYACSLGTFLQSLQSARASPEAQNGCSPERTSSSSTSQPRRQLSSSGEFSSTPPPMRQNGASTAEPHQNGGNSSPERQNGSTSATQQPLWIVLADLPVTQSTCVVFRGRLLAISGKSLNDPRPVSEIYVYCPLTNTWEVIGHISVGRFTCFAAVLSTDQLMVAGGYTDNRTAHDSVEFAS